MMIDTTDRKILNISECHLYTCTVNFVNQSMNIYIKKITKPKYN